MWGFQMTVDDRRGTAYMTFGEPTSNYYGGDRKGDNLFGNAVVAVDVQTGKYKWHFQTVHHDIWDFDLSAAPGLIDIVRDGKRVAALTLIVKRSHVFWTAPRVDQCCAWKSTPCLPAKYPASKRRERSPFR